jgi:hypothetical protein
MISPFPLSRAQLLSVQRLSLAKRALSRAYNIYFRPEKVFDVFFRNIPFLLRLVPSLTYRR